MPHDPVCVEEPLPTERMAIPQQHDRGASLVEYALLVALIAVVCIGALSYFGGETGGSFSGSGSSLFASP